MRDPGVGGGSRRIRGRRRRLRLAVERGDMQELGEDAGASVGTAKRRRRPYLGWRWLQATSVAA